MRLSPDIALLISVIQRPNPHVRISIVSLEECFCRVFHVSYLREAVKLILGLVYLIEIQEYRVLPGRSLGSSKRCFELLIVRSEWRGLFSCGAYSTKGCRT